MKITGTYPEHKACHPKRPAKWAPHHFSTGGKRSHLSSFFTDLRIYLISHCYLKKYFSIFFDSLKFQEFILENPFFIRAFQAVKRDYGVTDHYSGAHHPEASSGVADLFGHNGVT